MRKSLKEGADLSVIIICRSYNLYFSYMIQSLAEACAQLPEDQGRIEVVVCSPMGAHGFSIPDNWQAPLHLIQSRCCSRSGQRNLGASHATGSLYLFVDGDVILEKTSILRAMEAFHDGADVVMGIVGRELDAPPEGMSIEAMFKRAWTRKLGRLLPQLVEASQGDLTGVTTAFSLWNTRFAGCRSDIFCHVKGFDSARDQDCGEDWDLGFRLCGCSSKTRLIKADVGAHIRHGYGKSDQEAQQWAIEEARERSRQTKAFTALFDDAGNIRNPAEVVIEDIQRTRGPCDARTEYNIPFAEVDISASEVRSVCKAMCEGLISGRTPYIRSLEELVSHQFGVERVVATPSGTLSLFLALLLSGARPGKEIIIPSLTYSAVASAVFRSGATPIVVDVDEDTWTMNFDQVKAALTDRTNAIIVASAFGALADHDALRQMQGERPEITIIEDACQAFGARYANGTWAGAAGRFGAFSLFAGKQITSGEGGLLTVCKEMDNDLVNRLKDTISTNTMNINDVTDLGFNFRMSSLQAVLATEQLQRWPEIHARRMACYQDYIDTFADMKDIRLQSHRHNSVLSPWGFPVQFMEEETHCQAKCSIVSALKREGIDARPMFFPIDAILAQLNLSVPNITSCMVSRKIHESSIVLPLHAQMARRDIRRIRLIIEKCLRNSRK